MKKTKVTNVKKKPDQGIGLFGDPKARRRAQKVAEKLKSDKSRALEVLAVAIPAYFRAWEKQKRNYRETIMGAPDKGKSSLPEELAAKDGRESFKVCKRMIAHLVSHAVTEINKEREALPV